FALAVRSDVLAAEVRRPSRYFGKAEAQLLRHVRLETRAVSIRGVDRVVVAPRHRPVVAVDRFAHDGFFRCEPHAPNSLARRIWRLGFYASGEMREQLF